MTLDAFDPDKNSFSKIRTCVWDAPREADLTLISRSCLEGSSERGYLWDPNGVDEFYKGVMPKWLDDDALTGSEKRHYYKLNESDLLENDWLRLYAEVGVAYVKRDYELFDHLPVKVKKAVVQTITKEDLLESSLKLKSRNITFETR